MSRKRFQQDHRLHDNNLTGKYRIIRKFFIFNFIFNHKILFQISRDKSQRSLRDYGQNLYPFLQQAKHRIARNRFEEIFVDPDAN